jgi:hypothetical protein
MPLGRQPELKEIKISAHHLGAHLELRARVTRLAAFIFAPTVPPFGKRRRLLAMFRGAHDPSNIASAARVLGALAPSPSG